MENNLACKTYFTNEMWEGGIISYPSHQLAINSLTPRVCIVTLKRAPHHFSHLNPPVTTVTAAADANWAGLWEK